MYAYEYGLENFNEMYRPYNRITIFNDKVKIVDDNNQEEEVSYIGQTRNFGVYVNVTLDNNITTATLITDTNQKQYSAKFFEEYLSKLFEFSETNYTRTINGLQNQIDRPIVIFRGEYFAFVQDAIELDTITLTIDKPKKEEGEKAKYSFEKTWKHALNDTSETVNQQLKALNISVIIMISDDGLKLERSYQKIHKILENEVVIFIENKTGFNFTGSVFRVRSGSAVNKEAKLPYSGLSFLCALYNASIGSVNFQEIIADHLKNNNDEQMYYVNKIYGLIYKPIDWSLSSTAEALDGLTELIHDNLRSNDINRWKAHDEDGKENPNFNPILYGYNEIKKLEEAFKRNEVKKVVRNLSSENMLNEFNEKISNLELDLNNGISKLKIGALQTFAKSKLKGVYQSLDEAKKHVKEITDSIFKESKAKFIITLIKKRFLYLNAYIIGLYNSLVDVVTGIIQIISLACKFKAITKKVELAVIQNPSLSFSMFLEFFENAMEALSNLFTIKNIVALYFWQKKQVNKVIATILYPETVIKKTKSFLSSITVEQYGYAEGYMIGFFISEVLLTLATGGGKTIATAARFTVEGYYSILRGVVKAPITLTKGVIKVGKFSIDLLIKLFQKLKEVVKKFPQLLQKIDTWIDDLLKVANKLIDDTFIKLFPDAAARKTITDAGLRPTKVNATGDAITFCPIK